MRIKKKGKKHFSLKKKERKIEIMSENNPRPKSHEISLENLPILKIHNKDMKLIVDAILSRFLRRILIFMRSFKENSRQLFLHKIYKKSFKEN